MIFYLSWLSSSKYVRLNITGKSYDYTRKADPYLVHLIRTMLNPRKGPTYLHLGCGTGNYTIALSEDGTQFIGVDPSIVMLQEAKKKKRNITWALGTAEQIPYKRRCFIGALASLTLHHWSNLEQGFIEIHRILRPKSTLVIFTATSEQMQNYWLVHYFPEMMDKFIRKCHRTRRSWMLRLVLVSNCCQAQNTLLKLDW